MGNLALETSGALGGSLVFDARGFIWYFDFLSLVDALTCDSSCCLVRFDVS